MPSHPLLPPSPPVLPSVFSSIRVFSNESALCIRWPKCCSFGFSISPSNEYSRLISLGLIGFISLMSKGLSRSLLQHHNLKASNLGHSAFFMIQLSHPYMTTGKTITLTIQTCVSKVICLDSSNLGSSIRGLEKWDLMSSLSNFYFTINEA